MCLLGLSLSIMPEGHSSPRLQWWKQVKRHLAADGLASEGPFLCPISSGFFPNVPLRYVVG